MSATVWGNAGGEGSAAAYYNRFGELSGAHSYRALSLELPAGGAKIDADHDHQWLGELVYAELDDQERAWLEGLAG
jgi:hypothetical protein